MYNYRKNIKFNISDFVNIFIFVFILVFIVFSLISIAIQENTYNINYTAVLERLESSESTIELKNTKIYDPNSSYANNNNFENKNTYLGNFKITSYCACEKCCGKCDGITATGTIATEGRTIAVDPKVIPYGTRVSINGHEYIAEDCGGAINNNHIDMFINSHERALEYGIYYADVYIVD